AEALFGNEHPDQPAAQVPALVSIGEALCAGEGDGGEPLSQLLLDADRAETVRGGALERALRFDEVARRDELDAGVRGRTKAPRADAVRVAAETDAAEAGRLGARAGGG